MFRYYVSKRSGGEYDLVVILDPDDVEFALDFLSRGGDPGRHSGFLSFLGCVDGKLACTDTQT